MKTIIVNIGTFLLVSIMVNIIGLFSLTYAANVEIKLGSTVDAFKVQNPVGGSLMDILGTGNIGIGTTIPTEKLEVVGNIKATAFIGDGSGLTGISAGSSLWTQSGTSIYYNAGNIGIGTSDPAHLLHLFKNDSSTSPSITIEQAGTGDASMKFLTTQDEDWVIGQDTSDANSFKVTHGSSLGNAQDHLTIKTAGNVGHRHHEPSAPVTHG